MAKKYGNDIIESAKNLWINGTPVKEIAQQLSIKSVQVIYNWKKQFNWAKNEESIYETTRKSFLRIEAKEDKTDKDWANLEKYAVILSKLQVNQQPKKATSSTTKSTRRKANDISHLGPEDFSKFEAEKLYPHQMIWINAGQDEKINRTRFILKSRQIGATYTFAYEAFKDAVLTGNNQIFISATKSQALIFRSFIKKIALQNFSCKVQGNPMILSNSSELHFLSPNSFADSRSGNVYFDEVFKTSKFNEMEEIAAPMATLKNCKKTYFSSPTAISHDAYNIWSGQRYTSHDDINIDNLKQLINGRQDSDGIWRCACTVHNAIKMGWDLVDLKQLKQEMPDPKLFAVTYECKFIDDSDSVFNLQDILNGSINPTELEKYKNTPVTIGYDPAGIEDNASIAVLSLPKNKYEPFYVLETHNLKHVKATAQCELLQELTQKYDVKYMEIDSTGPGIFVGDFVESFYPNVKRPHYTPDYKARMVQKAANIIGACRLKYDENNDILPLSFLTIKQQTTTQGQITYKSERHKKVGHGDLAWAIMHSLMAEELNPINRTFYIQEIQW